MTLRVEGKITKNIQYDNGFCEKNEGGVTKIAIRGSFCRMRGRFARMKRMDDYAEPLCMIIRRKSARIESL